MVMTTEQKKAKESAAKFITYLHKKYYLQLVEAKEKLEEVQKCTSFRFLFKLGLSLLSYL